MKKIFLLIPLIIILFSLTIAPMALAECNCYCSNVPSPTPVANEAACVKHCNDNIPLKSMDPHKRCPVIETNKASNNNCEGTVCITDPLHINGDPQELYVRIVNALLGFVGIASLVTFVYAGFLFLISSGNPERVKKAKDAMLYAVIGIVVSIASYAILSFIFKTLEGATGQ